MVIFLMISTLVYLFVNFFVFERLIYGNAQADELNRKYESAIKLYNMAYPYYTINHFSEQNKEIYFKIPYKLSICYLQENQVRKSTEVLFSGFFSIQKEYGFYSHETASFMRKYLIRYYIQSNSLALAEKEFLNLLDIYKKIGCNNDEIADIARIKGDLYYQRKEYETAFGYYKRAYDVIPFNSKTDYEVFAEIINKICNYEIAIGQVDTAIQIYKNSSNLLKNTGDKQSSLNAEMLLKLGDIYKEQSLSIKDSISYYEEAISVIKSLPRSSYLRQNIVNYMDTLKDLYTKDNQFNKADEITVEIARQKRFSFIF